VLTAITQGAQAEGVVSLGQPVALIVGEERAVEESGWRPIEGAIEQELAGGGNEEISAADDFGDAHGVVIHGNGKLIGGEVIVAPDHEVTEIDSGGELPRSEVPVDECDRFAIGDAKAPIQGRFGVGLVRGAGCNRRFRGGRFVPERLTVG